MMRKVLKLTPVVLAAAALVVSLVASPAGGKSTERVSVRDDVFSPRSDRVSSGTKIVWRWRGDNPHNVRFRRVPDGASKPKSETQTSGRFARTFRKRGRYTYVCTIHEDLGMKGSLRVR
jgi:plastocyanin